MDTIKDKIFICLIIGIIGIEVVYLIIFYRENEERIIQTTKEIQLAQSRIQVMKEQNEQLPKIEEDLKQAEANKQDFLNKIPLYTGHATYIAELVQYMKMNEFLNIGYREIKVDKERIEDIIESEYILTFVGCYDEVIEFVDNLNQSGQVICIKDLKLDNEVQDLEYDKNQTYLQYYGEKFKKVVEATLEISIYWRENQKQEKKESNQAELILGSSDANLFKYQLMGEQVERNIEGADETAEIEKEKLPAKELKGEVLEGFTLDIGDDMTPGDTYKLDGPGSGIGNYIGLSTDTGIKIGIEVDDESYQMWMEDAKGMRTDTKVVKRVSTPYLEVISNRSKENEELPKVQVYVQNTTSQIMEIKCIGNMLEQIEILDKEGQQLELGETKGNLKLSECLYRM